MTHWEKNRKKSDTALQKYLSTSYSQGILSTLFFFSLAQKQMPHSESCVNLRHMPLILYARIVFEAASLNTAQMLTLKLGNI